MGELPTFTQSANTTFNHRISLVLCRLTIRSQGRVFFTEDMRLAVKGSHKEEVGMLPTDDIQNDSMYLCPVTIGVGPDAVTVNLDFDTGSADLWGSQPD